MVLEAEAEQSAALGDLIFVVWRERVAVCSLRGLILSSISLPSFLSLPLSLLPWQPPLSPLLARSRAIKKATAAFREIPQLGIRFTYLFFIHHTKFRTVPLRQGHAYVDFLM